MKKIVLLAIMLIAISIIALGTLTGATSEVKDPTTGIIDNPVAQAAGVKEAVTPVVKIIQLTPNSAGNYRHPAVAEDSKGNRLAIFRSTGGKDYDYIYCPVGGKWSSPKSIANGNQPTLKASLYANIKVDSTDRFHCQWEQTEKGPVYASFKDGAWTTPILIKTRGRYDRTSGLAVSSTDEVVTVDCEVLNKSKDIYIHRKPKNSNTFNAPFNLTRDPKQGSTQPCIALDSLDNAYVVWKSDYHVVDDKDNLVIFMAMFKPDNKDGPFDWKIVSPDPGWTFLPQVAVNNEDKVMTLGASSKISQYVSTFFDPVTKKLGPVTPLNIGLNKKPWHMFFSRMVAHGKDFYAAVMNPERILLLMKYDEAAGQWSVVAQVSNINVEMFSLYSGYDQMLIAWNSMREPSSVFLTTVNVDPYRKIFIKSVNNLKVAKITERSFFHKYTLNSLTWEANPENIEKGVIVTAQRIYRKGRSEKNTKWVRIAQVEPTVFAYADNPVAEDSDFVYAVTVVDDNEHESVID